MRKIICSIVAFSAVITVHSASAQVVSINAAKPKPTNNCTCPANTTTDFYANPNVDRSSCAKKKGYAPTGVLTPAVCSYATLHEALSAAEGFFTARAIASGGTSATPAVFSAEPLPLSIVGGTTLTTSDDPALGGTGFDPRHYIIAMNNAGVSYSVLVHSAAVVSGFTLRNSGTSTGSAVVCNGAGVSLDSLILDGPSGTIRMPTGLFIADPCDGRFSNIEARNFSAQGILVNSSSTDVSGLTQLDLHHNRNGLRALAGNFAIEKTSQIPGALNRIRDNTGPVITDDGTNFYNPNTTGYGVLLGDAQNQQGVVKALIQNTVLERNDVGLLAQQTNTTDKSTQWHLFGTEVIANRGMGILVYPTLPYPFEESIGSVTVAGTYPMISGSIIGNNGWNPATSCENYVLDHFSNAEWYSQVIFSGTYPASTSDLNGCYAHDAEVSGNPDDEVGCNIDSPHHCVFNANAPAYKCRPAYDISATPPQTGQPCTNTESNSISGYHRLGPENEDVRAGIVTADGAWVKAETGHFLTSQFEQHQDWTAIGSERFASNAGTECTAAVNSCPTATPGNPLPW